MARKSTGTMRQRKPGIWELAVSVQKTQAVIASAQRFAAVADWLSGESPKVKQQRRYETFQGSKAEAEARLRGNASRGGIGATCHAPTSPSPNGWPIGSRTTLRNTFPKTPCGPTHGWSTNISARELAPMKLDTVRTVDVEALLSDVRKEVPGSGQLAYQALNGAFARAVKMDVLRDNPVRKADKPKAADKEVIPPRRAEVEAFLEAAADHPTTLFTSPWPRPA